ncbi:MAG: hypothetical protein ACREGB_01580, partial [Candidatus Saccharimonadales bacterium]
MKKILFITGSLPPMECGVGYYTASLIEHLSTTKQSLVVLTGANSSHLDASIQKLHTSSWRLRNAWSLFKSCRQAEADIIHIQYPTVGYGRRLGINVLPWAIRLLPGRSKLVITLHEYFASPFLGRMRNLLTVIPAQQIIVSNEADRHSLPWFLRKKVVIIPIGSSVESDKPTSEAKDFILFFGFPFPAKQLELLIAAME